MPGLFAYNHFLLVYKVTTLYLKPWGFKECLTIIILKDLNKARIQDLRQLFDSLKVFAYLCMEQQAKRVPYGVSDFKSVIEQNQYYVDKTMFLPELERQPNNLFFIRPRRVQEVQRQL